MQDQDITTQEQEAAEREALSQEIANFSRAQAEQQKAEQQKAEQQTSATEIPKCTTKEYGWIKNYLELDLEDDEDLENAFFLLGNENPDLYDACIYLVHQLVWEARQETEQSNDQGLSEEEILKSVLTKITLDINCNLLPSIYYFEEKTSRMLSFSLVGPESAKKILAGTYFFHEIELSAFKDTVLTELEQKITEGMANLGKLIEQHKASQGEGADASDAIKALGDNAFAQKIENAQTKMESLTSDAQLREFLKLDYAVLDGEKDENASESDDDDEIDWEMEDQISVMELAVLLSDRIVYNVLKLFLWVK